MTSLNAEKVANEVITEVVNGRIPNKEAIQIKHGYAPSSARHGKAVQTKSYKNAVKPIVKQMALVRQKALNELLRKDLTKVQYNDLTSGINKMTHDMQLLSGGSTENVAVQGVEITIRRKTNE